MAKLFNQNEQLEGGNGVYINDAEIIDIQNSTQPADKQKDIDLVLELKFPKKKEEGKEQEYYTKKMFLSGNIYKNGNIPINLTNFLYAVGIANDENLEKIVEDFSTSTITKELKNLVIGKVIKTLQFVSGTYTANGIEKPSYKFWNMQGKGFKFANLFDVTTDNKVVMAEFKLKCEDENYPLSYTPEVLEIKADDSKGSEDAYGDGDEDLI